MDFLRKMYIQLIQSLDHDTYIEYMNNKEESAIDWEMQYTIRREAQ